MTLFDHDDGVRGASNGAPIVSIRLAGTPRPKGRPRFRYVQPKGRPGFVHTYSPTETVKYEAALRAAALDAMAGRPILDGPLELLMFVYIEVPASWPRRKREAAFAGEIRPTSRNDGDFENLAKVIDAFNPYKDPRTGIKVPILWSDDALVVDGRVVKVYARKQCGIVIEIRRAGPPPVPYINP